MKRRQHQQGIALITTLIMLSVVTLMAVAFLAVSRRERGAVATSSDRLDAKAMAEAGFQRAEAETVARILAASNVLSYDFLVSTNYLNPAGFDPGIADVDIANVNFQYANGASVSGADLIKVYRNLMVDPRAPVFVMTNNITGEHEFRYYLDFNRNGLAETNGLQFELDDRGRPGGTNFHVGDPEWIGVLQRPDQPHSGSNYFVGRYLYMVLPLGKSLDLNYIHNQAKRIGPAQDGYYRNQGVGSWELNLAAFLHELNTNAWNIYLYNTNAAQPSSGIAFDNALTLLRYRYKANANDTAPSYANLQSVRNLFGALGGNALERNGIDDYSDGWLQLGIERPYTVGGGTYNIPDNDLTAQPWPGAENPNRYFDPQELFTITDPSLPANHVNQFANRLMSISTNRSTYNRHTFYRLLGQLGADSVPNRRGRIHLNYDNRLDLDTNLVRAGVLPGVAPGLYYYATNFQAWTPTAFFTNAADRILKELHPPAGQGVSLQIAVTNIPVWPTNYYSPAVHRSLQVAANIFDATTNRPMTEHPWVPTVFRPVFANDPAGVRISGYEEVTNWLNQVWNPAYVDIDDSALRPSVLKYEMVSGIPVVIGAKKGYPNFNECELQTVIVAGRKLELVKRSPTTRPAFTNQLYTLGISNVFGIEFWNSYEDPFPRPLQLRAVLEYDLVLSNEVRVIHQLTNQVIVRTIDIAADEWAGGEFRLPIQTNIIFLPQSAYRNADGRFYAIQTNRALNLFEPANGFPVPVWKLNVTNRIRAALVDTSVPGGRLVDYVNLDNLVSQIDITRELFGEENLAGQSSVLGSFWRTNRVQGVPEGIHQQIQASVGSVNVAQWNSASAEPLQGQDKEKAIERFRQFVGLSSMPAPPSPTLRMQAPFSPGMKLHHNKAWQVNDPLVNDLIWDLEDPSRSNVVDRLPPLFPLDSERSNLGKVNYRYRPWQRNLYSSGDATDFDVAVKDPQITSSDAWDFPTNALPSVGWLGRVHRGTPWQTIYLKSEPVDNQRWILWSGHPTWVWPGNIIPYGTQPTNDWRLIDLFTTALDDNSSRGQLSVNQDGRAAWAAVLAGVPILTNSFPSTNAEPHIIRPNTIQLRAVVDGINAARVFRFGRRFNYTGEILSTPELTVASPYLSMAPSQYGTPADAVVERIPQMILPLLRRDEPRFVVFAYGQSLNPAPASVITDFGPYYQMPTNYVITGEYVTKTLMRLEAVVEPDPVIPNQFRTRIKPIKETYNEVPPTE